MNVRFTDFVVCTNLLPLFASVCKITNRAYELITCVHSLYFYMMAYHLLFFITDTIWLLLQLFWNRYSQLTLIWGWRCKLAWFLLQCICYIFRHVSQLNDAILNELVLFISVVGISHFPSQLTLRQPHCWKLCGINWCLTTSELFHMKST